MLILLHLPLLDGARPELEMKIIWRSSSMQWIALLLLRLHKFMFNCWWIPCTSSRSVPWWPIINRRRLNSFTKPVDVHSSIPVAICYHISCWTLHCLDCPPPFPLWIKLPSCGQNQPYCVTYMKTSFLYMLVV